MQQKEQQKNKYKSLNPSIWDKKFNSLCFVELQERDNYVGKAENSWVQEIIPHLLIVATKLFYLNSGIGMRNNFRLENFLLQNFW